MDGWDWDQIKELEERKRKLAEQKMKEIHIMAKYCESRTCLREQMLGYFGEKFDKANCKFSRGGMNYSSMCENCKNKTPMIRRDMTVVAQLVLCFLRE